MRFTSIPLFRFSFPATATLALLVSCLPLEGRPCEGNGDCVEGWQCAAQTCQLIGDGEPGADVDGGVPTDGGTLDAPDGGAFDGGTFDGGTPSPGIDAGPEGTPDDAGNPEEDGGFAVGPNDAGQDADAGIVTPVDAGPLTTVPRSFNLGDLSADDLEIFNIHGFTSVSAGPVGSLVVVAGITLPESLVPRLDEIVIEVEAGNLSADITVFKPDSPEFDDVTVDLVVEIPPAWALTVVPGSSAPLVVNGIRGDLDLESAGTIIVTGAAGDIVIASNQSDVDVQTDLDEDVSVTAGGNIILRAPFAADFELDGTYLPSSGADLGPFDLTGTDLLGTVAGIIGDFENALDRSVVLNAPNGAVILRGF